MASLEDIKNKLEKASSSNEVNVRPASEAVSRSNSLESAIVEGWYHRTWKSESTKPTVQSQGMIMGGEDNNKAKSRTILTWDMMFTQLEEYKRRHGNCLVPNCYPKLGSWVSTQRRHLKLLASGYSAKTSLTWERVGRLSSIGFVWNTKDPRHVPWETRYRELCAYKEKYGDCMVPIGFKVNVTKKEWAP